MATANKSVKTFTIIHNFKTETNEVAQFEMSLANDIK